MAIIIPHISVILPVYKVETYLARCIYSILNQTYAETEVILVDDGTDDLCAEMCDEYICRDSRMMVIHKINNGQSSARNAGLEICNGDYIYFCDSDDWIEPDLLEHSVQKILQEDADMLRFQCFTHKDDSNYQSSFQLNRNSDTFDTDESKLDYICNTVLSYKIGWELWLALYKAELINQKTIRFPQEIDIAEDLFFFLLITIYANRIAYLDMPLYHYCMRYDSTMGMAKGQIRINSCNELAYRMYSMIENESIKRNFYRIHNRMVLNELIGNLPDITDHQIAQSYLNEIGKITRKTFFSEQLELAVSNIDYNVELGFDIGYKYNAINRFIMNHDLFRYKISVMLRDLIVFPVRIVRKIKRVLRITNA